MDKKKLFNDLYAGLYFADGKDLVGLHSYLNKIAFLHEQEELIATEVPGNGNMNYVIRVKTNQRSFILKQARPWVEKYPSIEAPISRINVESDFYKTVSKDDFLKSHSPEVLLADPDNYILLLSDLGNIEDFSFIYQQEQFISEHHVNTLAMYIHSLHQLSVRDFPDNMSMRKLNHEHIFIIPFLSDSGLELDTIQSGLQEISSIVTGNFKAKAAAQKYGDIYLSKDHHLIHGDFYPGSWMRSDHLHVIDPEFCFNKFISIEIIRRLVGVAQLPLPLTIDQKSNLLEKAVGMLI